jgi:cellulose biosynthesis protein BcsQ
MIDADVRQQSLFAWGGQRKRRFGDAAPLVVVSASQRQLADQVGEARRLGWAVTIVDLPGGDTALNTLILDKADLALVATRATALDIQAACRMGRQLQNLGVRHRFVLTQTPPGLARVALARDVLARYAPVLATSMGSRVVYQDAVACGAGVTQLQRPDPAVDEMRALLHEILHLPELRRGHP